MSSYQYHGTRDLIAMPGRSVQTFPSGLVRVERSFMCRKGDVARYRNILRVNEPMPFDDGAPAIDGLYIFPEVQEQVRDDGFVEFRVTAYGRTNADALLTKGFVQGIFNTRFPDGTDAPESVLYATFTFSRVIDSDQSLEVFSELPPIEAFALSQNGEIYKTRTDFVAFGLNKDIRVFPSLRSFTSSNFGRFSEYVYTYQSTGSARIIVLTQGFQG
jgi:hypothetical protein